MTTSTTGRGLALVAGLVASAGALAILLQDAIRTHVWTLEHGLIPALMIVQIFTSHLIGSALSSRRWLSAAGFLVVALAATWGVLYTSVIKQSQVTAEVSAVADDVNARRADLMKRLAANQDMLDGARAKFAAECASGKGTKCDGVAVTVGVYEDAVSGNTAALAALGPARPVAVKADKMAELIAALTGRDKANAKSVLVLIEPFTYAVIFEGAALVCFGFAFARNSKPNHRVETHAATLGTCTEPSAQDSAQTSFGLNCSGPNGGTRVAPNGSPKGPKGSPRGPNGSTFNRSEVLADLLTRRATGRTFRSQEDGARHYGVSPSRFSEWLKEWEAEGSLTRQMKGRCKSMA